MDPDLENEDEGSPGVAVGGLGAAPTAFSAADLASQMNAANAMVDKQIAAYRQMLESGANRLRERRVGPTAAERLFAISEAFSRPTRTGQFGERMGMLAQTLGAQSRAKREEELARDEMLEKYGMKGIELELGAGQKRAQLLAALVARQQAADAAKAKAAASEATKTAPSYTYDQYGKLREVPAKGTVHQPQTQEEYAAIPVGAYYEVPSGPNAGTIVKKRG